MSMQFLRQKDPVPADRKAGWNSSKRAFRLSGIVSILLLLIPGFFVIFSSENILNHDQVSSVSQSPDGAASGESSGDGGGRIFVREGKTYTEDEKKIVRENWPGFRGPWGNGRGGSSVNPPVEWSETINIAWKVPVPKKGFNSPVIWDDHLFLTGGDEEGLFVYAFNSLTGGMLWEKEIKDIPGSPDEYPYTQEDTGLAASSTATDGKRVYFLFATGDLGALDFEGEVVWANNIGVPENHYGHSSSLILHKDLLLVQYDHDGESSIRAYDSEKGTLVWQTLRDVYTSWASPMLAEKDEGFQLIVASNPYTTAYNPLNGEELWSAEVLFGEVGPSPASGGDLIFVTNTGSSLAALSPKTGEIVWEMYDDLSNVVSPLATDNYVYMPTEYGVVTAFNITDGEVAWIHEFDEGFYSSPIKAGDYIFLTDRMGTTTVITEGHEYTLVSENPLGEDVDSTPAFYKDSIYIRGLENLYCIREDS